jgi:hypothetical protein
VQQLGLPIEQVQPVTVQVANGAKQQVTTAVSDLTWSCREHQFTDSFHVFDIPSYDIILGMYWLHNCGKMWIDWPNKSLRFKVNGTRITLKGIKDKVTSYDAITVDEIQTLAREKAVAQVVYLCPVGTSYEQSPVPAEIEQLLNEHQSRFEVPTRLPPHRPFDHGITLMPGVQPVNVKPYRYSPEQKDEIECQIVT